MEAVSTFFKRKDVVISAHRYGIDAMGAMAQGLFASLLIGTIIKTLGQQLGLAFLVTAGGYAAAIAGPVSYTHLRAHQTGRNLVCRLLLEKKKKKKDQQRVLLG